MDFTSANHPYFDFSEEGVKLKDGYSFVPHQDAPDAVHTFQSRTSQKGGGFKYGEKRKIYKKVDTPAPVTAAFKPEAPVAEEPKSVTPYRLSQRAAEANAGVRAYEQVLLNQQGTSAINNNPAPEQAFKNAYQSNLTNELKAKTPGALADKVSGIQQSDAQAAVNGDFGLNLAQSGMQAGQAGRRGLEFT